MSRLQKTTQPNALAIDTPTPMAKGIPSENPATPLNEQLAAATIIVPQTPGNPKVKLTDGTGEYNQGGYQASVAIVPGYSAEAETPQGQDTLGVFSVNYGGSGQFFYLGLFRAGTGSLLLSDMISLGDRVMIQSLKTQEEEDTSPEYEVVVSYLEHGPNQNMAEEPDVPVTKVYKVKNHIFVSPKPTGL